MPFSLQDVEKGVEEKTKELKDALEAAAKAQASFDQASKGRDSRYRDYKPTLDRISELKNQGKQKEADALEAAWEDRENQKIKGAQQELNETKRKVSEAELALEAAKAKERAFGEEKKPETFQSLAIFKKV